MLATKPQIRRNQLWRARHSGIVIRISRPAAGRGWWIVERPSGFSSISEQILREHYERAR